MPRKASRLHQPCARLLCYASVAAVIELGARGAAIAQEAVSKTDIVPTEAPQSINALQAVVVTSTRVERKGYSAPTPTTEIGPQEIAAKAPANLADFVNEMPSMASSATPRTTVYQLSSGNYGINALNLRNLGPNRTLVLLDGQRVGASTLTGWVDVDDFPQALVKRVDVVTGGASADWGSDAVAGVVNFILDKDFTGLKGKLQGGMTTYGDDHNYNASLTGGKGFLNDRGHILFSVEADYNGGITGVPRSWYDGKGMIFNPAYVPGGGQPQLLVSNNIGLSTATPGGIITSGPLKGTYFGPGGTPMEFNYGPLVSPPFMQGGAWQYSTIARSGDLDGRLTRQNAFLRASYDVTDHFQVYGQGSYAAADSSEAFGDQYNLGNITIQPDNAFIPPSIASQVTGPFTLGTFNQDLGPILLKNRRTAWRGVIGANGDFDALGSNWKWDTYADRSINDIYNSAYLTITANYLAAIDSVRDPSGVIVCRSTLTTASSGCVPYDIFGTGVNSQTAVNSVKGTSWGRTQLTEDVVAGTLNGNPFSDWAGLVSVATGFEHRREEVSGSNDPLSAAHAYWAGNYRASHGAYEVSEGFLETVVPLVKNAMLAKKLDLDAAARATSYSTSGYVTTWKIGATYSPIEDLTFRATRSRDIRAPNLAELYQAGSSNTSTAPDPFRGNTSATFFTITQGNLNLKPEKAYTMDLGVILKPRFLRGFEASVDYYKININGAIFTADAQTLISQCYAGNTALCSQIYRDSSGAISRVLVEPINLATQIARGVDIEATYGRPLDTIAPILKGNLSIRLLATHYLENYTNNGINQPTDTVGTNSANGGAFLSLPHWRYLATVGWQKGPLDLTITARGISAGVYNTSYVQCTSGCPASTANHMTINDNHIPGAIYYDTSITYDVTDTIQAFLAVDNVLDTPPVQIAYGTSVGGANISVNPALYDVLGRTFRLGFRFNL